VISAKGAQRARSLGEEGLDLVVFDQGVVGVGVVVLDDACVVEPLHEKLIGKERKSFIVAVFDVSDNGGFGGRPANGNGGKGAHDVLSR
jgi:hypothetical protein